MMRSHSLWCRIASSSAFFQYGNEIYVLEKGGGNFLLIERQLASQNGTFLADSKYTGN